jgi:hypothetical protein
MYHAGHTPGNSPVTDFSHLLFNPNTSKDFMRAANNGNAGPTLGLRGGTRRPFVFLRVMTRLSSTMSKIRRSSAACANTSG